MSAGASEDWAEETPSDPADPQDSAGASPAPGGPPTPTVRLAAGAAHRRSAVAVLVAVLLGGAAATVAVDVVAVQTSGHALIWPYRQLAHDVETTTWSYWVPKAIGAGAILVGVLLVAAATRRPWRLQELRTDVAWLSVVTTPRSLRRAVTRAALSVDGAGKVRTDLHPRRVRIAVRSPLRDPRGLDEAVRAAVNRRLVEFGLEERLRVSVTVRGASAPPVPQAPTTPQEAIDGAVGPEPIAGGPETDGGTT